MHLREFAASGGATQNGPESEDPMGTEGMQSQAGFSPSGGGAMPQAGEGRDGNGGGRFPCWPGRAVPDMFGPHAVAPDRRVDGPLARQDAVLQRAVLRNGPRRSEIDWNNRGSRTRRRGGVSDSVGPCLCECNFARRCSQSARHCFPNRLRKPGKLSDLCGSGRAVRTNVRKRSPVHFSGLRILSVHTSPNPGRIEAFGARRGTERKTRREEIQGASLPLSLRPSSTEPPSNPAVSDGRD